ncbi:DUF72 domain-containing protein [Pistricoccus aurantiacus]|uniref:DUF72 domain-containing protein n=1 Tax=Pistricoccus aurantiacus TaxID=1883414 RepID=A0A5B8SXK9_9GAMM|nr:DUF72 domain-containing protein [Pistricoccus aurantiacus]QEA40814.1 DUF72 domain-containing protein [Pistricoccus aurantiacus]
MTDASRPTLHLGLPMWANSDWRGTLYPPHSKSGDWLEEYAKVFNAVEGNTTFYSGAPKVETVVNWARQAPEDFRFCFKLPARLTHEQRLAGIEREFDDFIARLAPLHDRLGPMMVQLPRDFGPRELPFLEALLARWPPSIPCAVEVRHEEFFHKGQAERDLNRLLITYAADRVMLDVRAVFSSSIDPSSALIKARQEKPKRPLHVISTGNFPLIRFIGHFEDTINQACFTPWIEQLALWIKQGKTPFLFVHTPDNRGAPKLARALYRRLKDGIDLDPLREFPGERQQPLL